MFIERIVIQYILGINPSYDEQFKLLLQGQEDYHKKSVSNIIYAHRLQR
jgi:hypothetical protein